MSEYKDYGFSTDNYCHIHSYLLEPLLATLDKSKNQKILDIGCGNGWLTNLLIEQGFDAYGTDASETGIQIAKQKNQNRFYIQDLSKDDLPIELQSIKFDTILSTEVIEHLYSPRDYLRFCKRILQKTGYGELIISTPYHGYLKNVALSVTGKMDKHFTVLTDGMHIKFWSRKTLTAVLEEQGFVVTEFIGCGRLPYLWKSMIIKSKL
jgi:2-polyprenyl-3-methyl-5-hydroxy-6-metoxy-1,4-benzoquinol methylase